MVRRGKTTKHDGVKKRKRRGLSEESGMNSTQNINNGYIKKMRIEEAKQRLLITFPLVTEDNDPRVKTMEHFATVYGESLSDGKWHQFQMPEDDAVYEACLKNKKLELTKTRFALALIYDTDSRGRVKAKNGVDYSFYWVKVSDFVKNSIIDIYDDANCTLKGVDIMVKLSAKDNALKMQDLQFNIFREKGVAISNKAKTKWRDIQKEAEEIWDTLEDNIIRVEDDDTILALVDDYGEEDEYVPDRKKKKATTRKRRFSRKDL